MNDDQAAQPRGAFGYLSDAATLEQLTRTAEVQVTIVATVAVPADSAGNWLHSDAIRAACWSAENGRADYDAHEVTATGAPEPFTVTDRG